MEPGREASGELAAVPRGVRGPGVEDVAVLAWRIRDVLERTGAEVVGPAADVPRALAPPDEAEVDAAVLDMNLDGERADPIADVLAARGVPFVFVTGYGSGGTEGRHAARPILGKPLKPQVLVRTLAGLQTPPRPPAP